MEKEPALRQFLLLVGGLRALGRAASMSPRLVLDAYLLRSLAVAGYAPALDECAMCGSRAPSGREVTPKTPGAAAVGARRRGVPAHVRVAAGGLVCRACRAPGAASTAAAPRST